MYLKYNCYGSVVKQKAFASTRFFHPLDRTHLDAVRGLILLRGSKPVHQKEELVGAMQLRSSRTSRTNRSS